MTIDIGYCDTEATKTVTLVMPGGTMPPQPDHVHDDETSHPVTVLANQVGDFDPGNYASSEAYIVAVCHPLIPAPSGAAQAVRSAFLLCAVDGEVCFDSTGTDINLEDCPITAAHAITTRHGYHDQGHRDENDDTGAKWCHATFAGTGHVRALHV